MTLQDLRKTVEAFPPKAFLLFGVYLGKELIAVHSGHSGSQGYLVYILYGAPEKFDNLSPVVYLTGEIYRQASLVK